MGSVSGYQPISCSRHGHREGISDKDKGNVPENGVLGLSYGGRMCSYYWTEWDREEEGVIHR